MIVFNMSLVGRLSVEAGTPAELAQKSFLGFDVSFNP